MRMTTVMTSVTSTPTTLITLVVEESTPRSGALWMIGPRNFPQLPMGMIYGNTELERQIDDGVRGSIYLAGSVMQWTGSVMVSTSPPNITPSEQS
jgi:hypothetical protein